MIAFISAVRCATAVTIFARAEGERTTANRQGWRFVLDGAVIAPSSTRTSTSLATGSALNVRTLRRVRSHSRISGPVIRA